MKTCHVMVGLPATGKSFLVKKLKESLDSVWIYSTDMFIEAVAKDHGLTYSEVFATSIKDAQDFNDEKVTLAFQMGIDIIWDQTNLGVKKRATIINKAKQYGYRVEAHCILPPEPNAIGLQLEWKRRLEGRPGKTIPTYVLENMVKNYHEASDEEGFDQVTYYNMWGEVLYKTQPLV